MQLVGRDFPGVPLAEVEVFLIIHADIVSVGDEIPLFHERQDLALRIVGGDGSAGARDRSVVLVEDGDETAPLPHTVVVFLEAETGAGIQVVALDNVAAEEGSGEIGASEKLTIEREPSELVAYPCGAERQGLRASCIDGIAMCLNELSLVVR